MPCTNQIDPHSPRATLAFQKRPAQSPYPLGLRQNKRAKTQSSSSNPHITDTTTKIQNGQKQAQGWFDQANNSATAVEQVPFVDTGSVWAYEFPDDPPFYVKDQTSDNSNFLAMPSERSAQSVPSKIGPTAPTASLLAQMNATNDNDSEDFRSVIDDLTIENKKLRKKLSKFERLHCSHLQEEKLFEVRIHGLAAHRKRELEDTLRRFASSIDEDSPCDRSFIGAHPSVPLSSTSLRKLSSSSTSYSRPLDSTYASMSGTGLNQSNPSHNRPCQAVNPPLLNISEALMPKHPLAMSDKSRSKVVVRRLEQIFTGKGVASRLHRQSHQQQEVSNSATEADRSSIEARAQRVWHEGTREAPILPNGADLKLETIEEANAAAQKSRGGTDGAESLSRGTVPSGAASPEQRPTRPLDLDLHRAQVPSDNIEYIRHLGLINPEGRGNPKPDGDDGWVYLNLLISMAQLHTLNVTPEFVRKAVADVSDKFELSADGTKVKWLGGTEGTQMSSDGDESEEQSNWKPSSRTSVSFSKHDSFVELPSRDELDDRHGRHCALPVQASEFSAPPEIGAKRRPVNVGTSEPSEKFHYKPLFFHTARSEEDEDSGIASDSFSSADPMDFATGINSGFNTVLERQTRSIGRKHESGPIIFFNRAKFCTDLGGDLTSPVTDKVPYCRCTEQPVGCSKVSSVAQDLDNGSEHHMLTYLPPKSTDVDIASSNIARSALDLEDLKTSISDCASDWDTPMSMEASGLGGVQPGDNFVVQVQMRHGTERISSGPFSAFPSPLRPPRKVLQSIARTATKALHEKHHIPRSDTCRAPVKSEVISAVTTNMAPSSLPPPSYVCLPFSSSGSDDTSEDYDEDARDPRSTLELPISRRSGTFLNSSDHTESEGSSYEPTSYGSDDSSSIDLLAHARVQDPEAIRAREREFDSVRSNQQSSAQGSPSAAGAPSEITPSASIRRVGSDVDSMSVDGDEESES
ncbi:MAG: hypothetical protein Q9217_004985 [Psora testacea]